MEVTLCVQKAEGHAGSLLAGLNLQRERAQFCDCVLRQSQNPGQLYPAHRCILAASSPVLASILPSAGALVELQAPCLSDSALALVLNYIYTGNLPHTDSQQQHESLIAAASYLQMDELQEALRNEVNTYASTGAEGDTENIQSETADTFHKYVPLADTCNENSAEREDRYCDRMDARRSSCKNCTGPSGICNVSENTESCVNTSSCRQVTDLTSRDVIQRSTCTAEVHRVSKADKEVQEDQFHSAGTVKPGSWQKSSEEELLRTVENRRSSYVLHIAEVQEEETGRTENSQRNREEEDEVDHSPRFHFSPSDLKDNVSASQCSSSLSPSSPRPCCGVPVIRHSSSAALSEVLTYQPVLQVPFRPSRAPESSSNDRIVEGITQHNTNHHGVQNHTDRSDPSAKEDTSYKCNADQSDSRSNRNHDAILDNGVDHMTEDNDAQSHSFQSHTKRLGDDLMLSSKDCHGFSRGLEHKSDLRFDHFPSKHQRDCSDCHRVLKEQCIPSQDLRVVVPLPVKDADSGSDSRCEDRQLKGQAEEEQSYTNRRQAEKGSHCDLYTPSSDWCPNLQRAEATTEVTASGQHEHNDTARVDVTDHISLEHEISESHRTFTMPVDSNTSDPTYNFFGPSYHGHLHYHCIPQEDLSQRDSDYKHSSHSDHSDQSSDEEVGTFASSGLSSLRRHFASTDKVVLLDISTKPSELLVSYRRRSDGQEKWVSFDQRNTCENGLEGTDREYNATPAAEVVRRKVRAKSGFQAEDATKVCVEETHDDESVGMEQSMPAAEVKHKGEGVEGDNHSTTLTVCSTPSVPASVQAPMSSTLSVCIPSALSASMPTNISARLSTPVHHPFQCSLCDRSFSQRGSLNRHVRSHLGVRPFPCPRCPMTFSRQYRVSEHMRVHQRCVIGSDFEKLPASAVEKMPQK